MITTLKYLYQIFRYGRQCLPLVAVILKYIGNEQLKILLEKITAAIADFADTRIDGTPIPPKAESNRKRLRERIQKRLALSELGIAETATEADINAFVAQINNWCEAKNTAMKISTNDNDVV
jgi:hypothetical protein